MSVSAEVGLRGAGALLIAVCASLGSWLYRSLHLAPHPPGALHYAGALLAASSWSLGWALLAEGPSLFRQVPRPRRTFLRQF